MKFSDRYQYMILCEDRKTASFITNILKLQGINFNKIRSRVSSSGIGSGEAFVRREYPRQLKAFRTLNYSKHVLILCTDADKGTVKERKDFLERVCREQHPPIEGRKKGEPVIIWIPKWHIETWIRFFGEDKTVTEDMKIPHDGKPVKCKREAKNMSDYLQNTRTMKGVLPSIVDAKEEYERVCQLIK